MTDMTISVDLGHVASQLGLPQAKVQRTVDLLDEGNTVPFITRYRKDQTGGLDEEQIRLIQADVARQRQLAERKATILKSVESQGKLT
ncbi:MAG: Tex-like N-terminal domain-containing protein, partial [Planctomycetota bacterium]